MFQRNFAYSGTKRTNKQYRKILNFGEPPLDSSILSLLLGIKGLCIVALFVLFCFWGVDIEEEYPLIR